MKEFFSKTVISAFKKHKNEASKNKRWKYIKTDQFWKEMDILITIDNHSHWTRVFIKLNTSIDRNPLSQNDVTAGDGSNHSGDIPNKFFKEVIDDIVTAPHLRTMIRAYIKKSQQKSFKINL